MEQILITFLFFIMAAVLVEKLTEIIGNRIPKMDPKNLSIFIGFIVALYAKFNILELVGIPFGWNTESLIVLNIASGLGILFSGLILSTGANGVHDLLSKLQKSKQITQEELSRIKIMNDELKDKPPEASITTGVIKTE